MRNKIIVVGVVAAIIYFRGARSHRPVKGSQPETLRHQAERLWKDPKAVKARKKVGKKVTDRANELSKQIRSAV